MRSILNSVRLKILTFSLKLSILHLNLNYKLKNQYYFPNQVDYFLI